MKRFDLIVLGGGTAGPGVAHRAAAQGWDTALVESNYLGGTCINFGCIPSKTLISSSRVMQTVREAQRYGVITEPPRADWPKIYQRKKRLVSKIRDHSYRGVQKKEQITLYEGLASFTGPKTVEVNGDSLTAEKIVIATGARPGIPPVPGLSDVDYLTSTSAMELEKLPKSLLILGGGIIALEFSQLFARLGVSVTIIQRGPRLAGNLEPEISDEVRRVLEAEGIDVKTNTRISSIGSEANMIYAIDETESGQKRYSAEQILVAAGRDPNTDMLALDKTGVDTDKKGYILVDENFKTADEGIWAIGDVIGGMMFTHKAWHDGLLLSRRLLEGKTIATQDRLVPFAVFTDPEVAGVGLGESAAAEAGFKATSKSFPFAYHGRALAMDRMDGFVKLVLDANNGTILGAHIIGPEAGEIIHELIAAMHFGATVYDLQEMMHIHPTLAEAINSTSLAK